MVYLKKISAIGKVFYPSLLWKMPATQKILYLTFDDGPVPEITPWVLNTLKDHDAKATFFCMGENILKHPEVYKQVLEERHRTGNHTYNHIKGWDTSTINYLDNIQLAEEAMLHFETPVSGPENSKFQIQNFKFQIPNSKSQWQNPKSKIPKAKFNIKNLRFQDISLNQLTILDKKRKTENRKQKTENRKSKTEKLFRPPYGRITPFQIKKLQKQEYKIVMWDVISGDFDAEISAKECFNNVIKYSEPGSIVVFHDSIKASENLKEVLPRVLKHYQAQGFEFKAL